MDDYNQIEVPPSFLALFTAPGGHRLVQPMGQVRERYELCEDMAQLLSEHAAAAHFKSGGDEGDVLRQMRQALSGAESSVQPAEAGWVVTRIAEVLGWAPPTD
jgi:hypothetical protein